MSLMSHLIDLMCPYYYKSYLYLESLHVGYYFWVQTVQYCSTSICLQNQLLKVFFWASWQRIRLNGRSVNRKHRDAEVWAVGFPQRSKWKVCSCLFGQLDDYETHFVEIIWNDLWKTIRCIIKQEQKIKQAVNL